MDTLDTYRQYIEQLMTDRASRVWDQRVMAQTIFDRERDHYQLVHVGWFGSSKRIYGVVLHVDIIDGKIWVQQDGTETGIAVELHELGVPKDQIVLGFDPPLTRHMTGFAPG